MKAGKTLLLSAVFAVGAFINASAVQAADYAVILKTLSNPFWQSMKQGVEDKAKELGVEVDILPLRPKMIRRRSCSFSRMC